MMEIKIEANYSKIQKLLNITRRRFKAGKFRGAHHVILSNVAENEVEEIRQAFEADFHAEVQRRALEVYNGD